MGKFIEMYRKQGGTKLLREFWDNGVLGYAIGQIMLLGKSKKALEILRLGVQLKMQRKIERKFLPVLREFDAQYQQQKPQMQPNKTVWVYWSTGMEATAPELVKRCFRSLQEHLPDRQIVLLSKENYHQYVEIPDYIIDKYNRGIIQHVHFADLLRIELLAQRGGTWIDSTVFCMDSNVPSYMLDAEFFIFQKLKPGLDGHSTNISSWFITAHSHQKFILAQQALLRNYWLHYDKAIDYFFFHHFFSIIARFYAEDWKRVIQFPNSFPHVLLLQIFEPFSQEKWDALKAACPFQKLSYKFDDADLKRDDTYYKYIMHH